VSRALEPGELAERVAALPVAVDGLAVERASLAVPAYYEGAPRPTGLAVLRGGSAVGRGECVAWTPREQKAFATACERLVLPASATVGELSLLLEDEIDDPYHRVAVEGAAIDLALRQAGTNLFALAGRPAAPVAFCWSIGREPDPLAAIAPILDRSPDARLKIDVPPEGWLPGTWQALAETGRVVVLDFKRESDPGQLRLAHAWIPDAWLEDPPAESMTLDRDGAWRERVSIDGYVLAAVDLDDPEIPPVAVNVKAPRVGGWLEALRCLEECRRRDLEAYFGGMFEVDVGRSQTRVLASLYTAGAWNDLAPLLLAADDPVPSSPLAMRDDFTGFSNRDD
jgi:hypothetical protein